MFSCENYAIYTTFCLYLLSSVPQRLLAYLKTIAMIDNTLPDYFRQHQVSPQWHAVLRAIAQVLPTTKNKAVFFQVGEQLARGVEARCAAIETLTDLEIQLSAYWSDLNWGWVALAELDDAIAITHHASPLAEAFGDAALPWVVGLLEGFYQTVFKVLGAGDAMRVQLVNGPAAGMQIHLRFGQHLA